MKPISVSDADFKYVVSETYYIDKTSLISEVISNKDKAILFCRPRRFGKTLNMSMLYYFFSNSEDSKKLFQNLNISKNKNAMSHLNKYPTIFLSLKDLGSTLEEFEYYLRGNLVDMLLQYKKEIQKNHALLRLTDLDESRNLPLFEIAEILKNLINCLHEYYNEQVVVLVDEYDNAVHYGIENNYHKEVLDFLRRLFAPVTKDNNKVKLLVFTGILRITKQNLFSGMNNLNVCDTMSSEYTEYFGLTEQEVKNTLKDFNQLDRFEEIKHWYNGYIFHETLIYNPFSTLFSIKKKQSQAFWLDTGNPSLILKILEHTNYKDKDKLMSLYDGKKVKTLINFSLNLDKLFNADLFSLLVTSGYLKVVTQLHDDICEVSIVNNEIRLCFKELIMSYYEEKCSIDFNKTIDLVDAFCNKDNSFIEEVCTNLVLDVHHTNKKYEARFHADLFTLLKISNQVKVVEELEAGAGQFDLAIFYKNFKAVIEIKRVNPETTIENTFKNIFDLHIKKCGNHTLDNDDIFYAIVFDKTKAYVKILDHKTLTYIEEQNPF